MHAKVAYLRPLSRFGGPVMPDAGPLATPRLKPAAPAGSVGPLRREGPHRVMVDLSHAADGFVGIAQDIRMIFAMLDRLGGVAVSGLLMPTGRHDLPRIETGRPPDPALAAGVLHWMARNWSDMDYPRVLGRSLRRLIELRRSLRGTHALVPMPDVDRSGAIWRVLFGKTLGPELRARILARGFMATDLSVLRIIDRANYLPFLRPKTLAVQACDFVLFCMPRPVRLPPGVRQLVRFHDAVPVTDTDTVSHWRIGMTHQRLVRGCDPGTVFICNSPQSREDLIRLDPTRAERSVVIPCALPWSILPRAGAAPGLPVPAIIAARRSQRLAPPAVVAGEAAPAETAAAAPYLLTVSTLEPRKNYPGLIRAWERLASRAMPDLRLVVVANGGWREDEALTAMRPHVASGRLIHLEGVPADELRALMRGAACFVFPSFNEGFGYPPLEALAAGCPVVVGDLPVMRWMLGEAALYADPYDPEHLAGQIERLVCRPEAASLRAELLGRRHAVIERFLPETVAELWAGLLDRLRGEAVGRAPAGALAAPW